MKVLSLVPYKIFPATFGGQRAIALFNKYLARETDLVCVTVRSNLPRYAAGYRVHNILSDAVFRYANPFYFFTLRRIIRRQQITHLIIEHPYFGWLGMLLKTFTGVRLVVRSHNIESLRWKSLKKWWWKILWWYERTVHRAADYSFFITGHDRHYAQQHFGLQPFRCLTVVYGTETSQAPPPSEKTQCRKLLQERHRIEPHETILLFNGALDYKPNLSAVQAIVHQINPLLLKETFPYKIIICGKGLPAGLQELKEFVHQHVIYAGFVDDIETYFKGADVFLNPVIEGGGIKTKLIEALSYNMNAVSSTSGAFGVDAELTNGKLTVVADRDWQAFAKAVQQSAGRKEIIPPAFFESFYWENCVKRAVAFMA